MLFSYWNGQDVEKYPQKSGPMQKSVNQIISYVLSCKKSSKAFSFDVFCTIEKTFLLLFVKCQKNFFFCFTIFKENFSTVIQNELHYLKHAFFPLRVSQLCISCFLKWTSHSKRDCFSWLKCILLGKCPQ